MAGKRERDKKYLVGDVMKPTRTINKLHFEDLSPARFEDLCLMMVYRMRRWHDINHFGRNGSDDGIDIDAVEELENQSKRIWSIQCKRYQKLGKRDVKSVVDAIVEKNKKTPDIILLIAGCDVSKDCIEYAKEYTQVKGVDNFMIWTASILEAKLYSEYHDLLFAYFGVNLSLEHGSRIATIRRNISLKKKMRNDFLKMHRDPKETLSKPYMKFEYSEIIIHSVDDNMYPSIDIDSIGISGWFKVEPYDFYFNGIQVILGINRVLIDEDGTWDVVEYNDRERMDKYAVYKIWKIGCIPFENIIDYDISGDEFYLCPHVYCDFRNGGQPYEQIVYYIIGGEGNEYPYDQRLDNDSRKRLP